MTTSRPDYAREIRNALVDPLALCDRLGLLARGTFQRQPRGAIVRCPWHEDRSPSCSVRVARDGTIAVRCHACGATGDALSLVAQVHGINLRRSFRDALATAAEVGGMHALADEIRAGKPNDSRVAIVAPVVAPEPERDYPSAGDLSALMAATIPVTESAEVASWLNARGVAPEHVVANGLAVALKRDARLLPRFATYKGRSWVETGHTLILPMRDVYGAIRSVRAGRVVDGDSPKRLPPAGCKATALVMADALGVEMLAGTASPRRATFVEGEPDFLTWATRPHGASTAVIGIVSGSWNAAFAERVPSGATCMVRTDHDAAGDRYAAELQRTLRRGRFVVRSSRDWTPEAASDDDHEAA